MVTVIIAAAGQGKRMGMIKNKVFLPLQGEPVLLHSIRAFSDCPQIDKLVIVAAAEEIEEVTSMLNAVEGIKQWQIVAGGMERQHSISNALDLLQDEQGIVMVHDGARPLISSRIIVEVLAAAKIHRAAGVAVPVKDTIKTVDKNGFIIDTPDRSNLWAIQTPQAFDLELLRNAYNKAFQDKIVGTDDAMLVERLGVPVKIVPGAYENIKITTPEDLVVAKALQGRDGSMMRMGMGYDVHRLVEGRKLILGGVEIPYHLGLLGHSDADVLLHAIKDSLLGAAGLGDIGTHFPDSDPKYKGASSLLLLEEVAVLIKDHGYAINNIDATIVAQQPKLAPHIPLMKRNIAQTLQLPPAAVNVKATTTEELGFAGRGEGIAAYAVVSLAPLNN